MAVEFLTGVGRIVWGNPARAVKKTDIRTKAPKLKADGSQAEQWVFGVAFPKNEFMQHTMPFLQQEAITNFPNGVPGNFAWKIKDGDGTDNKGQLFSNREGYAGCYVLTVSTEAFAPPIYKFENNQYRQIEPNEIKCGDYVRVKINCVFNGAHSPNTPGLYINPQAIELVGFGSEILSKGVDPNDTFGGTQAQLPPGASATPTSPQPNVAAPFGVQPAQTNNPVNPPQTTTATAQVATPPPAHDFVNNAGQAPNDNVANAVGTPPPTAVAGVPTGGSATIATGFPTNGMPGLPTN